MRGALQGDKGLARGLAVCAVTDSGVVSSRSTEVSKESVKDAVDLIFDRVPRHSAKERVAELNENLAQKEREPASGAGLREGAAGLALPH